MYCDEADILSCLSLAMVALQAAKIIAKLYDMFMAKDCTLLEINPMAEDTHGTGDVYF